MAKAAYDPIDPDTGKPRCTANRKHGKGRCRNTPVTGRTTCRMHGGTSAVGLASHAAVSGGKYSKWLKPSLRENYETFASDEGRATLVDDVHLTKALMADALQRMGDGANATTTTLASIRRAYDDLEANQRAGKGKEAAAAFVRLGQYIDKALDERHARDEVTRLSDHHRKLLESELKLVIASRTMMTAEESALLVQAMTDAVFATVQDPDLRREIAVRFAAILHLPRPGGYPQ